MLSKHKTETSTGDMSISDIDLISKSFVDISSIFNRLLIEVESMLSYSRRINAIVLKRIHL